MPTRKLAGRDKNAQTAVDELRRLCALNGWTKTEAWRGIALLLMTCNIFENRSWKPFFGGIVFAEKNRFQLQKSGKPNINMVRGFALRDYIARELGIPPEDLCSTIGLHWQNPQLATLQPNNLVGHAFRSLGVEVLRMYGDPEIEYEEEVRPADIPFVGLSFNTRSVDPKIDIVARRNGRLVAIISARWRYRHDRVDVVDEAMAYKPAAHRMNSDCALYALLAECDPARLYKVVSSTTFQMKNAALDAAVHLQPEFMSRALGTNGRLANLKSLDWLIDETFKWK